ncbi:hypothetical protein TSUD_113700 [Trifolium subterraneum]|uniref:Late embryogenesis abundant protein LEA-2 subgroup domain-containing protein n=1 Tax=Trifolium subterraneum TaxID=3900 RepID=A0A2Z6M6Y6_TRISU|nr:hypothetical protein TSUD_113700 [Trifolium subterraneum]
MQATALSKPMADQVQPNTKSMDDRVHQNTLPGSRNSQTTSSEISALKSQMMSSEKRDPFNPFPPPGTYVIHVPKDHIYQCPPPKNDQCYANYTRQKSRRSRSCCPYWLISILLTLIVFLGIAAGVFYLIFHPESPHYAIDQIYVKGMNLTSSSSTISPEFNLTIKANNDNDKIGIYYENDITVEIFYRDALLSNGMMPTFYQPSNNVTVFQTVLKGNNVELRRSDQRGLVNAVAKRIVPLSLKLRAPVKIKLGYIKTWKIRINVDCDVTVNQLTGHVKIVHKHCNNGLDLWL